MLKKKKTAYYIKKKYPKKEITTLFTSFYDLKKKNIIIMRLETWE